MKPTNVILAVIGGAVAGAALGLLLAPKKGEATRRDIYNFLHDHGVKLPCKKMHKLVEEIESELQG